MPQNPRVKNTPLGAVLRVSFYCGAFLEAILSLDPKNIKRPPLIIRGIFFFWQIQRPLIIFRLVFPASSIY